MIFKDKKEIL